MNCVLSTGSEENKDHKSEDCRPKTPENENKDPMKHENEDPQNTKTKTPKNEKEDPKKQKLRPQNEKGKGPQIL